MARRKYLEDRVISNDEFTESYTKWKVLIKSTLFKFRNYLNEHDLESCGNYALLLCIQRYDGRPNIKFSTLLVNYINWECKRTLSQRVKYRDINSDISAKCISSKIENNFAISDILNSLPIEESNMIKDRYINQLTLNEMAAIYEVSRETIRKRLLKIRKKLVADDENDI